MALAFVKNYCDVLSWLHFLRKENISIINGIQ